VDDDSLVLLLPAEKKIDEEVEAEDLTAQKTTGNTFFIADMLYSAILTR
jgi:hypothetical protein